MRIGDRVKVINQDIIGTIIRYDCGNKVVILDDDDSWQDENEEPSLVYSKSELEVLKMSKEILKDYPLNDAEFLKVDEKLYTLIQNILGIDYNINEDKRLFDWFCEIRNKLCEDINNKKITLKEVK